VSLFLPPLYRQPLLDIHTHPWPGGGSFLRKNPPPSVGFEPTSAGTATSEHCLRQPCGHRATSDVGCYGHREHMKCKGDFDSHLLLNMYLTPGYSFFCKRNNVRFRCLKVNKINTLVITAQNYIIYPAVHKTPIILHLRGQSSSFILDQCFFFKVILTITRLLCYLFCYQVLLSRYFFFKR
jgi:hypothetical protein